MSDGEPLRDPHTGPVPDAAWHQDDLARQQGRVEIFNATRPGGLDGWTMDVEQYDVVRDLILGLLDASDAPDGSVALQEVVRTAQARLGDGRSPLFPKGRLTNYVRFTKTDLEARCDVERLPRSSPQRIVRWRPSAVD